MAAPGFSVSDIIAGIDKVVRLYKQVQRAPRELQALQKALETSEEHLCDLQKVLTAHGRDVAYDQPKFDTIRRQYQHIITESYSFIDHHRTLLDAKSPRFRDKLSFTHNETYNKTCEELMSRLEAVDKLLTQFLNRLTLQINSSILVYTQSISSAVESLTSTPQVHWTPSPEPFSSSHRPSIASNVSPLEPYTPTRRESEFSAISPLEPSTPPLAGISPTNMRPFPPSPAPLELPGPADESVPQTQADRIIFANVLSSTPPSDNIGFHPPTWHSNPELRSTSPPIGSPQERFSLAVNRKGSRGQQSMQPVVEDVERAGGISISGVSIATASPSIFSVGNTPRSSMSTLASSSRMQRSSSTASGSMCTVREPRSPVIQSWPSPGNTSVRVPPQRTPSSRTSSIGTISTFVTEEVQLQNEVKLWTKVQNDTWESFPVRRIIVRRQASEELFDIIIILKSNEKVIHPMPPGEDPSIRTPVIDHHRYVDHIQRSASDAKYLVKFMGDHKVLRMLDHSSTVLLGRQPKLSFQTEKDCFTFHQAIIPGKFELSFELEKIKSDRGEECVWQTLQLWERHGDRLIKFVKNDLPDQIMEYPVTAFRVKKEKFDRVILEFLKRETEAEKKMKYLEIKFTNIKDIKLFLEECGYT